MGLLQELRNKSLTINGRGDIKIDGVVLKDNGEGRTVVNTLGALKNDPKYNTLADYSVELGLIPRRTLGQELEEIIQITRENTIKALGHNK
ncbi:MAG TPA: hypothetical protein VI819_02995 [Patescibacteria group bacterium]|nr:hypothetical protein [Patescibacteria group bacterium]